MHIANANAALSVRQIPARERNFIMGALALMLHPTHRWNVFINIPPSFRHRD
jgi:hypothetical protein